MSEKEARAALAAMVRASRPMNAIDRALMNGFMLGAQVSQRTRAQMRRIMYRL